MPAKMLRALIAALAALYPLALYAASPFQIYDLSVHGEIQLVEPVDLNRDGLKDLVVISAEEESLRPGRKWLSIFLQTPAGFPAEPDQLMPVPPEVIVFDFGDVAGDPTPELVYFSPGGIHYFSFENGKLLLRPRRLFAETSLFLLPDPHRLQRLDFVRDFDGDGRDEIFAPGFAGSVLYSRAPADSGASWQPQPLAIPAEMLTFAHFDPRFSVGHRAGARYATPYLLSRDANRDRRPDLLAVYRDTLLIFLQRPDRRFSEAPDLRLPIDFGDIWPGAKIQRTHLDDRSERRFLMRIDDLDADGNLDAVGILVSTRESLLNPHTEVRIYRGRSAAADSRFDLHFPAQPDQIVQPDGMMMVLDILDLNGDGRLDLVIPAVKINISKLIKMLFTHSIDFQTHYFLLGADGRYPKKANHYSRMSVKFSFRGGAASPVYEIADMNGDGVADIVGSNEERRLLIFYGNGRGAFSKSANKRIDMPLPQDGTRVHAVELNGDSRADLIILFEKTDRQQKGVKAPLRVLLSRSEGAGPTGSTGQVQRPSGDSSAAAGAAEPER